MVVMRYRRPWLRYPPNMNPSQQPAPIAPWPVRPVIPLLAFLLGSIGSLAARPRFIQDRRTRSGDVVFMSTRDLGSAVPALYESQLDPRRPLLHAHRNTPMSSNSVAA